MSGPPPATTVTLHAPVTTSPDPTAAAQTASAPPPAPAWLAGKWHVTHSTLPMWRSKRNVSITYTPLANTSPPKLDDLVEYQPLSGGDKLKSVRGVDAPVPAAAGWAWDWRGKGWLVVASSRWEWAVTYFAKTLFTPAGLDVYSRHPEGLRPETLAGIRSALEGVEDEGVRKLAGGLFEVRMD
ncbi:hypothetical protein B0J12DRAFT_628646, partial [Macrophomina phaseolina]